MPHSRLFTALGLGASLALSQTTLAQTTNAAAKYHEPTRGFFIEHGLTAPNRQASIELHTGSDGIDAGGGIRLGLQGAELILNSGLRSYDVNEALLKYQMPSVKTSEESNTAIQWALVGGIAHLDLEDANGNTTIEQTNIKLGAAATVKADAGTFTIGPRLVIADSDTNTGKQDDTFVEVDLGAYVGLVDTQAGQFSVGAEAIFTTEDNRDDTIALGMRWLYNSHVAIDVVPVVMSDGDQLGLPGLVRLNARF
ncbi:MAG: hypothetical protein R3183_00655 [Oleiphilaceae bacterium]|nr:hypothetical protein [Oleiphilaceae bacterium]